MSRIDIIQWFIDFLDAKTYLEIGVRYGESFLPIRCENKIGVDINKHEPLEGQGTFYWMSGDEYFENQASNFDVAFIDGNHTYEQSLRDVENCLMWMNNRGVILLHDCNPKRPEIAGACAVEGCLDWSGEVWKTIVNLRTRPHLFVSVVDNDYGIGIVMRDFQDVLDIPVESIVNMTYEDLDKNRKEFLNLVEGQ